MAFTAKELAAELGISAAAVSMALNNKPGVSTATRHRILEAAKAHGIEPKNRDELPPSTETGTIALVSYRKHGAVVDDGTFFSELIAGVEDACRRNHYSLNMHYLSEGPNFAAQLRNLNYCTGMLLLATEMRAEDFLRFESVRVPMVVVDAYYENLSYDCVVINNFQGAYLGTSHQIRRWRCQPGYLRSSYPIANFDERADGFYKAIRENGMPTSKSQVLRLAPSVEGACDDMRQLLKQGEKPVRCYFADNDFIAVGAMKALKEAGYRIPEDVSIVGFDDVSLCKYAEPSLTTIRVPKQYLGNMAVSRLLGRIKDPRQPLAKLAVTTSLVRRDT